tara:strand:- start:584 stop:913 length:330 start_codon:yes stop_codon:yes gene_type:complete
MKTDEKRVYIVQDSEDGLLGVFKSIKKAYDAAKEYLTKDDDSIKIDSYKKVSQELNPRGYYMNKYDIERDDLYATLTATITMFPFNKSKKDAEFIMANGIFTPYQEGGR